MYVPRPCLLVLYFLYFLIAAPISFAVCDSSASVCVAMTNAPEGVKECADYITTRTNNEDGVAEVLEKFVL